MSRFIHTDAGEINLDYVVSARTHHANDPHIELIYLEGRDVRRARVKGTESLVDLTAPAVPAQPGYSLVKVFSDAPHEVHSVPVVAWRLEPDFAHPICPGEVVTDGDWGILCPNGSVVVPFEAVHNNIAEFQRAELQRLERKACQGRMTDKATAPYESYVANGWTEAQLVGAGLMRERTRPTD